MQYFDSRARLGVLHGDHARLDPIDWSTAAWLGNASVRVTVNADQAVVTDTVVTGKPGGNTAPSPALLTTPSEKLMPMLEEPAKFQPAGGGRKAK